MTEGSCTDALTKGIGACPVPPLEEDEDDEEEDDEEEEEEDELEPEPPPPQAASRNAEIMQRLRQLAGVVIPRGCLIDDNANNSKSRARDIRIRRKCERSQYDGETSEAVFRSAQHVRCQGGNCPARKGRAFRTRNGG